MEVTKADLNQGDKEWQGEVAIALLEEKRRQGGYHHGGTCGEAVQDLLDQKGVFALVGVEVEVAFGELFQQAGPKDEVVIAVCAVVLDTKVTHRFPIVSFS